MELYALEALEWRYATKQFDPEHKLTEKQVGLLKESIRLTPTSYGLQAFHVIVVSDPAIKDALKAASYGQAQVDTCSHFFVFCACTVVTEDDIKGYQSRLAETREIDAEAFTPFMDMIRQSVKNTDEAALLTWNAKQAYIASGMMMQTAAEAMIDTCPMEGFTASEYNRILGLDERNLHACLAVAAGYRSNEDTAAIQNKVRKTNEQLFTEI